MGRLKRLFSELPTANLRNKAWARWVRRALLPRKESGRPFPHLINGEIERRVSKATGLQKEVLAKLTSASGEGREIVSSGRWMAWWGGSHPSPNTVNLFSALVPKSENWFSMQPVTTSMQRDLHPLLSLLFATDLWAKKVDASDQAMLLLLNLAKSWAPQTVWGADPVERTNIGWELPLMRGVLIPPSIVEHYVSLEPASLIEFMLCVGEYLAHV